MLDMSIKFSITKGMPAAARAIRSAVFMEEQGYVDEFDEMDEEALHLLMIKGDEAIATARLFELEGEQGEWLFGRIAIVMEQRGKGLGRVMMQKLEEVAFENGASSAVLSAQCIAQGFYEKCGYRTAGESYLDEGEPHIRMKKLLTQ